MTMYQSVKSILLAVFLLTLVGCCSLPNKIDGENCAADNASENCEAKEPEPERAIIIDQ